MYTCEQAERYRPRLPAISTKNLFLRDEGGTFFLVMTACEKQLDLKGLGRQIASAHPGWGKKLHFGSPEALLEILGVTPGAVTLLGLVNDRAERVRLLIDREYWGEANYLCHPLVNTATLVLTRAALQRFCALTGHEPEIIPMPARLAG